jgi:hypothetical protein
MCLGLLAVAEVLLLPFGADRHIHSTAFQPRECTVRTLGMACLLQYDCGIDTFTMWGAVCSCALFVVG